MRFSENFSKGAQRGHAGVTGRDSGWGEDTCKEEPTERGGPQKHLQDGIMAQRTAKMRAGGEGHRQMGRERDAVPSQPPLILILQEAHALPAPSCCALPMSSHTLPLAQLKCTQAQAGPWEADSVRELSGCHAHKDHPGAGPRGREGKEAGEDRGGAKLGRKPTASASPHGLVSRAARAEQTGWLKQQKLLLHDSAGCKSETSVSRFGLS